MQELVEINWGLWVSIIAAVVAWVGAILGAWDARREKMNIANEVRSYRDAKAEERLLDSLSQCHTLLEEVIRGHYFVSGITIRVPFPNGFQEMINRSADTLNRLSWVCGNLGKALREIAGVLKNSVSVSHPTNEKYLSNALRREMVKEVAELRDRIVDYLQIVVSEGLSHFPKFKTNP